MVDSWLEWDPPSVAFRLPIIDHPITYYALCFVVGFVLAYFILTWIFSYYLEEEIPEGERRHTAQLLVDKLLWFIVIGMIVGARLGHVLLYDWPMVKSDPLMVFKVWQGGLASHTGVLGILIAITLYSYWVIRPYPSLHFLRVVDATAIASGFVAGCIRIGNFINQEILGTASQVPWAVIFKHPIDGSAPIPRHPVQLYEAFFYFTLFALILFLWKRYRSNWLPGRFTGLYWALLFSGRFFLEFWKERQSLLLGEQAFLVMGQYLSIPFILIGLFLFFFPRKPPNTSFISR